VPDNYRTRLDFAWPIYTGGRADALTRAAQAEADASESDLLAAQADLRHELAKIFAGANGSLIPIFAIGAVFGEGMKSLPAATAADAVKKEESAKIGAPIVGSGIPSI
jgi:hypothetical protein